MRNIQCMIQFFNEYNQELTMVKEAAAPIAQSLIAQLSEYNFTLPIKHDFGNFNYQRATLPNAPKSNVAVFAPIAFKNFYYCRKG